MAEGMEIDQEGPRGRKRTADQAGLRLDGPQRIRALDQDVVNKIAAGEIIVAPVHALKELLENAVDAGSSSIEVLVKDGGLKLLQITDNGHGINKDDMPILCERFTTSKLKAFEDLNSIGTYGFRGEALASISHIAHMSITTRVKESSCAYKAYYSEGKLAPPKPGQNEAPKAVAGRPGTQITVEDLFYNVPTRRRAFRSGSEEYAKILDLVGRYAVHCTGVAFSCKKHGDSSMGISVAANATTADRIRQIHGSAIANELIEYSTSDSTYGFEAKGWASNANYHIKKTTLLLFINHRAVESLTLKKAIEKTYAQFLPKGGHPFIYLSLDVDPARVDVNVHPTKREVHFLNEDEIIESICTAVRTKLATVDTSRTFTTQSLLPGARLPTSSVYGQDNISPSTPKQLSSTTKPYENNLVRTDSKLRKITSMLPPSTSTFPDQPTGQSLENNEYTQTDRQPILCRLKTVKELRAAIRESMHHSLTETFSSHTFVGIVDDTRRIAAIQSGVKLLLIDYGMVSAEYFYQLGLTDFANFGVIKFEPSLNLHSLLTIGAEAERANAPETQESPLDWKEVISIIRTQLLQRREMLKEYFNLEISPEGDLISIPLLVRGYTPSLAKLPRFLLNLGPRVDWKDEKNCFDTFLHQLAAFYVPEQLPPPPLPLNTSPSISRLPAGGGASSPFTSNDPSIRSPEETFTSPQEAEAQVEADAEHEELSKRRAHVSHALEHILFPAFRARLVATKPLLKGVVEVADLKGLYRVFERC